MKKVFTLGLLGIMGLSLGSQAQHHNKKFNQITTKKELTKKRISSLALEQNPLFKVKKQRAGSRLIAEAGSSYDTGLYTLVDSTKYFYNGAFGYDYTPYEFEFDQINQNLYGDFKNTFDKSINWADDGSGLALGDSTVNVFDANHLNTLQTYYGISFPITAKSMNSFNANQLRTVGIDSIDIPGFFSSIRKTEFSYNANNKVNLMTISEKDTTTQTWIVTEIDSIFYTGTNLTQAIIMDYTVSPATPSIKIDIQYNANNLITTMTNAEWNGTSWDLTDQTTYTYNASNQITAIKTATWDGTAWIDDTKNDYTYGTATYPTQWMSSTWDGTQWTPDSKNIYTYNASNQMLTALYTSYNGATFDTTSKYVYYYESFTPNATSALTSASSNIRLYPNPVQDLLHIELPATAKVSAISVFDIQGKNILQQTGMGSNLNISTANLLPGMYMVSIENENATYTAKFIK